MNPIRLSCLYLAAVLVFPGCAGTTHRAIPDAAADRRATGIRYYDTSPYLFIHTDNQGGLTSEFVYLPDTTKKRAAKPFAFLAKNKATLTWEEEGVALTGSDAQADASDVPKAVVAALKEAGETFVKGQIFDAPPVGEAAVGAPEGAPAAYLFKVVKRDGKWGLVGASTGSPSYLPGKS